MKKILFIVDAQNDFMPGGALPVPDGDKIIPRINELIRDEDVEYIFYSKDWHPKDHTSFASQHGVPPFTMINGEMKWPDHCIAYTNGSQIHPDINMPLEKNCLSKFFLKGCNINIEEYSAISGIANESSFHSIVQVLKDLGEIIITGLALDYCILNTAKDIKEIVTDKIKIIVDLKGCRGVNPETTAKAIEEMKSLGIIIQE